MDERIPQYLCERLTSAYGAAAADAIAAGYVRKPTTLRANTLKASADEVAAALAEAGVRAERVPWYPDAFILPDAQEKDLPLPLYQEGKVYLQSLSAMLPALLMELKPGSSVLDMCAAPGGKTTQIAALSGGQVSLTACERDAARTERLRFNLERQGARRVSVMQTDARQLDDFFRFDEILLDAPCTGSGTLVLDGRAAAPHDARLGGQDRPRPKGPAQKGHDPAQDRRHPGLRDLLHPAGGEPGRRADGAGRRHGARPRPGRPRARAPGPPRAGGHDLREADGADGGLLRGHAEEEAITHWRGKPVSALTEKKLNPSISGRESKDS